MKKRIVASIMAILILLSSLPVYAEGEKSVRILFTHDVHSYLEKSSRVCTLIKEERAIYGEENMLLLDGGDFSQGTIFQASYETDALELSMLTCLRYTAAAIGNHEWDHGGQGFANMLESAYSIYDYATPILCGNLDLTGDLTEEQQKVKNALEKYNEKAGCMSKDYLIKETASGVKVGIFALSGLDSIKDSPTAGMKWENYIDAAKRIVAELDGKCDAIICLSHSGTKGDGKTGEDIELAMACPQIDMIVSAHSHTTYEEPVFVGNTLIGSVGSCNTNLGAVTMTVDAQGKVAFKDYNLKPVTNDIIPNEYVEKLTADYLKKVDAEYTSLYDYSSSQVLAHSSFDFISLDEMYGTHQEYPLGNLIADSYLYAARKAGIEDIDVALVGLGTIRESIKTGDVTVADAFKICSLGMSEDGSSGHPLVVGYIYGSELKLLVQLDASLGPLVNSIKMSYSGLRYRFNTKRMLLDRAVDIHLVDEFGLVDDREIVDDQLYKVCCNMYAANMLGMVNDLTGGILKIVPKDANGNPVENLYTMSLKDAEGRDLKEWVAFSDYLASLGEIPSYYENPVGRKVRSDVFSLHNALEQPGIPTIAAIVVLVLVILILIALIKLIIFLVHLIIRKFKN